MPGESLEQSYGLIVNPGASRGALFRLCLPVLDLLWSFVLSAAPLAPARFPSSRYSLANSFVARRRPRKKLQR